MAGSTIMRRLFAILIRASKNVPRLPLYYLAQLFPRDKRLWVFGAWFGKRYSDNSRYVFDYVNSKEPDITAVWMTSDPLIVQEVRASGKRAYMSNSFAGYWYSARAGLAVVNCGPDDVNAMGIARAKKVQLWHGTPIKKIKFDDQLNENPPLGFPLELMRVAWRKFVGYLHPKWDIIVAPSAVVASRFESAFRAAREAVKVLGNPRADVILSYPPKEIPAVKSFLDQHGATRAILFAPTHRKEGHREAGYFDGLDSNQLDEALAKHDAVLFAKLHFFHQGQDNVLKGGTRLKFLRDTDIDDVNYLLPHIDVLISDYSGIIFDFLILDRPVILAPFDIAEYKASDREMYPSYEDFSPGPKCRNWTEVISEIDAILTEPDEWCARRREECKRYNEYLDQRNSERLVDEVKTLLGIS